MLLRLDYGHPDASDYCTLFLSMSRVSERADEQASEAINGRTTGIQHDYLPFNTRSLTASWDTALRQTYNLAKIYDQCKVKALRNETDSQVREIHAVRNA